MPEQKGLIHLGVTGTRAQLTHEQHRSIKHFICEMLVSKVIMHNGCCVGADMELFDLGLHSGNIVGFVMHPPIKTDQSFNPVEFLEKISHKPTVGGKIEIRPPLDYLERDREIVGMSSYMIAAPRQMKEQRRGSGTWYTIRQARKFNKPMIIFYPSGLMVFEHEGDWLNNIIRR